MYLDQAKDNGAGSSVTIMLILRKKIIKNPYRNVHIKFLYFNLERVENI